MNSVDILVIQHNGWWSVICPELEISGYGDTQEAATAAFERSFTSTMLGRFRASFLEPKAPTGRVTVQDFPAMTPPQGQIVRRTTLRLIQAKAA